MTRADASKNLLFSSRIALECVCSTSCPTFLKPSVKLERQSNDYQISVEFRSRLFTGMTLQQKQQQL